MGEDSILEMKIFTQKYSKLFYLTTAFIITLGITGINYSYSQPTPPTTSEVNQTDLQAQDPSLTSIINIKLRFHNILVGIKL